MTILKADVRMPWSRTVRGPLSSNTFHASHNNVTGAPEKFATALKAWVVALDVYSSHMLGSSNVSVYDLNDAVPRDPVWSTSGQCPIGADSLPTECAILLQASAMPEDNVPRGRFRTRVYVGPCSASTLTTDGHVSAAAMQTVADAYEGLAAALAGDNIQLVAGSVQYGWKPIVGYRVGNEFATVRRRQLDVTGGVQGMV